MVLAGGLRSLVLGVSLVALAAAGAAWAQEPFVAPAADFGGMVRASAVVEGEPITAGAEVEITGRGFAPGQRLTLQRGTTVLNLDGPIEADAEGGFSFALTLPEDAAAGLHPIVVIAENPSAATVFELKVSPDVPLSGEDGFLVESVPLVPGLYQSAYSATNDRLFVTSAVGRPPITQSLLVKVDPATLEIEATATPPEAPARPDGRAGGLYAVYGVGVDDANDTVWATNTRQDTIAVYRQSDLSLLRQFEPGTVPHSRDVIADPARGRVYASATGTGLIKVFDGATLEELEPFEIVSGKWGQQFSVMSLELDAEGGRLFTVSISTDEAAIVDLDSGEVRVLPLPHARTASGVAFDPETGRILVASQNTDNLLILDGESGAVLHDVPVGAGALNVAFEPVGRLAYVSNRGAGTVTVVDLDGQIVANLDGGTYPNHVHEDGKGNIFAVNKSRGENDPAGDRLWRITPKD